MHDDNAIITTSTVCRENAKMAPQRIQSWHKKIQENSTEVDKYNQILTNLIWPAWFPRQSLAVNRNVFSTSCRAFLAASSLESIGFWLLALKEWNRLASSAKGFNLYGAPRGQESEVGGVGRRRGRDEERGRITERITIMLLHAHIRIRAQSYRAYLTHNITRLYICRENTCLNLELLAKLRRRSKCGPYHSSCGRRQSIVINRARNPHRSPIPVRPIKSLPIQSIFRPDQSTFPRLEHVHLPPSAESFSPRAPPLLACPASPGPCAPHTCTCHHKDIHVHGARLAYEYK